MDEYTDEQCAQLRKFKQEFLPSIAGVEPMRAMIRIQDTVCRLAYIDDELLYELIVHFLAEEYGAQVFYSKVKYGTNDLNNGIWDAFWQNVHKPWAGYDLEEDYDYEDSVLRTCAEAYHATKDHWEQEKEEQRGYSVRGYDWEYK